MTKKINENTNFVKANFCTYFIVVFVRGKSSFLNFNMGVKDLWQLLAPIGRRVSIETLEGKVYCFYPMMHICILDFKKISLLRYWQLMLVFG